MRLQPGTPGTVEARCRATGSADEERAVGDHDDPIFDCDNHYYEAEDAFTRHVPEDMRSRCVQWAEIDGRRRHLIAGRVDRQVTNPTFDPIARPGSLREYYQGNPSGLSADELIRSGVEPLPAAYVDRDARVARLDEQGLEGAWLFPTLGVLYEDRMKGDIEAVCTTFGAFNRWLDEDWGMAYRNRIFAAPYISLADVEWACAELEWALERDARTVVMRPAAVWTADGPKSPADPAFDPFWARADEAGVCVVAHVSNSGYATNGYPRSSFLDTIGGGTRPTVVSLNPERAIYDFLLTLAYDKLFERFPNLRVASVENGSEFLADLFRKLDQSKNRLPGYYDEDPAELFRKHVWINPFWEDDLAEVVGHMGADRVIFGSDWPHMEGLEHPRDILADLVGFSAEDRRRILHDNGMDLNERRVS
jgi:predicted TIM-barrel fold metal-dependent hydrolase